MSITALPPVTVTGEATGGGAMSLGSMLGLQAAGSLISGLFNQSSAKDQMRFQERMANTAYQRAAKDLEAAGLNRIIALGNPAASPSGAMGTMAPIDASAASAADVNRKTAIYQRELLESQAHAAEQSAQTGKSQQSLFDEQANTAKATAEAQRASASLAEQDVRIKRVEADWSEKTGIPTSTLNSSVGVAAGALGSGAKMLQKWFPKMFK